MASVKIIKVKSRIATLNMYFVAMENEWVDQVGRNISPFCLHHHFPNSHEQIFSTFLVTEEYNISWIWIFSLCFFFVSTARRKVFVRNAAKWKEKTAKLRAQAQEKKTNNALSLRINNKNTFWYKTVCTARPIDSCTQ